MTGFTILGGRGFIGRHLARALSTQGHAVWVPERDDPQVYARALGHVVYCIGVTADFRDRPFDTVEAHVSLLARILREASFESLLYLSSTRVYQRGQSGHEGAALPVQPDQPDDLYNLSKLMGESLCHAPHRVPVRVARLSNVIGPDRDSENFVAALIREALAGRIVLRSAPESAKDYVLLEDVVGLLPRIALGGRERTYNVASGMNTSHADIVARLVQLTGCQLSVAPGAARTSFPPIDIRRIRAEFDFAPGSVLDRLPALLSDRAGDQQ